MNSQNLASDQNTRARTRRKRHATRSPSESLCVSSESCATRVLHRLSRLSPKLETTVILRCSIVEANVCAIWGCALFFLFLFCFCFFWFVCLFVFFSCTHLLILPRFPCSVSVLSGAGFFALGKRSRCELRLWIALQYHLIDVLGSCISVQPAEIVPMERWLNFQHRRRDWTAAVLFESLLQEVDVFSIFVHLRRDQMITDRKLGFEARCTCSYEFQSLKGPPSSKTHYGRLFLFWISLLSKCVIWLAERTQAVRKGRHLVLYSSACND